MAPADRTPAPVQNMADEPTTPPTTRPTAPPSIWDERARAKANRLSSKGDQGSDNTGTSRRLSFSE